MEEETAGRNKQSIVLLDSAMKCYRKPENYNSDQGSQFTSAKFMEVLMREGIRISIDARGRCIDNANMERFWWSLKYEDIKLKDYESLNALRLEVQSYVNFYNHRRNHANLPGLQTPDKVYFGGCNLQSKAVWYANRVDTDLESKSVQAKG